MKSHKPALVVLESCGSAHFSTQTFSEMGHDVKLIAPKYVKPFIKRQKNDAPDAEAIVVAAQRPEMRFVATKTKEQREKQLFFVPASAWFITEQSKSIHYGLYFMNMAI